MHTSSTFMLIIGQVVKRPQPMRGRLVQYNKQTEGHLKDGERSEQNSWAAAQRADIYGSQEHQQDSTQETMSTQFSKGPTFGLSADVRNKVCTLYNTNAINLQGLTAYESKIDVINVAQQFCPYGNSVPQWNSNEWNSFPH